MIILCTCFHPSISEPLCHCYCISKQRFFITRKGQRGFTWTPVIALSAQAFWACCWSHFQSVLVFSFPSMWLLSGKESSLPAKQKKEEKAGLGRMALGSGVTMTRALLIQLRSFSCGSFPLCSFQHYISLRRYEWKWLCHLVFASRMWKTNSGRIWEARIDPVFRHFIPRSSGIWTVGAPHVAFRFFTCWHYRSACRHCCSFSPAGACICLTEALCQQLWPCWWWSWSLPKSL